MAKKRDKRKRYVGKYPVNSRITIDYTKKKPKVKFGYPNKDTFDQMFYTTAVLIPGIIISIIILVLFFVVMDIKVYNYNAPNVEDCNVTLEQNYNKLIGINLSCMTDDGYLNIHNTYRKGYKFLFFDEGRSLSDDSEELGGMEVLYAALSGLGFVLLIFLTSYFIYLFYKNTKFGQRIFPEVNKKLLNAKYHAKIRKVPANKKIEIPLFHNVYLDYRATKEFSKYLEKMEIVEHPFSQISRKGKKEKQVWLWKAVFHFKEIPEKGMLEMWWT